MKFPTEMIIKLKSGETLIIKLKNQVFDKYRELFDVTIEISKQFLECKLNEDTIKFTIEEK